MTPEQYLWAVTTLLVTIVGILIRTWMGKVDKVIEKMDTEKLDIKTHDILYGDVKQKAHAHGTLGQAGEVIK
jgi:hypothetical protein